MREEVLKKNNFNFKFDFKLGFVGTGKMAEAIIKGLLDSQMLDKSQISAYEKSKERAKFIKEKYKIFFFDNLHNLIKGVRYILIAVKPQNIAEVLKEASISLSEDKNVLISIAAGVSTGFFENYLKQNIGVIRVMPNSPALLGKGICAISLGKYVKESDANFAIEIFKNIGDYIVVEENKQNIITALSGSGPAYFFLFCKALINSAIKRGLSRQDAKKLVLKTLEGSSEMLKTFNGKIDELIKMVASPGGTTEAALKTFLERGFENTVFEALLSAENRAVQIQNMLENLK